MPQMRASREALGRLGQELLTRGGLVVKGCSISRICLLGLLGLITACTDSQEVNATFSRTRVSWAVFDPQRADGLSPLLGFDQALKTTWVPRPRGVFATDLVTASGSGIVAVSHLGLLVLDDSSGTLTAFRPGAQWPLAEYQTDRLFLWKGRVFLTLLQESPAGAPPASLAWWAPGQPRMAFYPIPSQVMDPSRQAVAFIPPAGGVSLLGLTWKRPVATGWVYEGSNLVLDDGTETPAPVATIGVASSEPDPALAVVRARMAEKLGGGVPTRSTTGAGTVLVFTDNGWVSVARVGEGVARLYHLPELGAAGRYTGALALTRGFVFTWETAFRGYSGTAGLVHVPFAVLAP